MHTSPELNWITQIGLALSGHFKSFRDLWHSSVLARWLERDHSIYARANFQGLMSVDVEIQVLYRETKEKP